MTKLIEHKIWEIRFKVGALDLEPIRVIAINLDDAKRKASRYFDYIKYSPALTDITSIVYDGTVLEIRK